MVVGTSSSTRGARVPRIVDPRQRRRVGLSCAGLVALSALAVVTSVSTSVDAGSGPVTTTRSTAAARSNTATTHTVPAPVIALAQFPVQGLCNFIDSYGAARSGGRRHEGVDIIAKKGQFVYAVQDGVLTKKYVDAPGLLAGNGWRLTTSDGTYFFYGHLSAFGDGLAVGSSVVAGQIIGHIGDTGSAGTSHLHFEIHPGGGESINPTQSVKAIDGCKTTTPPPAALVTTTTSAAAKTTPTATTVAAPVPITKPTQPATPAPSGLAQDATARWQFIEPVAVLTASPATALAPRVTKKVAVAGVGAISKTTSAVVVRISASSSQAASVLVHPCDATVPLATTLFVEAGPMAVGYATVGLVGGQLCVTSNARVMTRITVVAQLSATGVGAAAVPTHRVLDTRTTARLAPNQITTLTPETLGIASTAQALSATFTVLDPKAAGTLLITPCGGNELRAPFNATPVTSFSAVVRTNATGLCVSSTSTTNLIIDVHAVWSQDAPGLLPTTPVRRFDSRELGVAVGSAPTPIQAGIVTGESTAPSSVQVNLTLIGKSKSASVFVWPCSQPKPDASAGVVAARRHATFSVLTSLSDGTFCIASNALVDVVADVVGAG